MKSRALTVLLPVLLLCAVATGCTPQKARALRIAAVQFKVEADGAIDAIETIMVRELEPPPQPQAVADAGFVKNMLEFDHATRDLTVDVLTTAIRPDEIERDADYVTARNAFLASLRLQYVEFAAIFDGLEQGSFFAGDAVAAAAPYARKLTVQMAGYAKHVMEHPPILFQHRTQVLADIEAVLESAAPDDEKSTSLLVLKERWQAVLADEAQMQQTAVERCLRAATLGRQVTHLIDRYSQMSLTDLQNIIALTLDQAGEFTGRDMTELKADTTAVFDQIRADPIFSESVDIVLGQLNDTLKSDPSAGMPPIVPTDASGETNTDVD